MKEKMMTEAGFRSVEIVDHNAVEIFPTMDDLLTRLNSAPIIPDFDQVKDKAYLEQVEKNCKTSRGIESEIHRVVIVARKDQ